MPLCPWEPAKYLFFSSNVPPLFYYSHGISVIFALVFGLLLFFKAKKVLSAKLLFIITLLFSAWVLLDLYIWASNDPSSILFFWSLIILVEVLIYIFSVYFVNIFNGKKDVSIREKLLMFFLVVPIIIALPTSFNLTGIDISYCVALEGMIAKYYIYGVEIFSISWILFHSSRFYKKTADADAKKQIFFSTVGILFFLLALSYGNFIGSLTEQWDYSQFGLFAMPFFIGILAYLVTKYNSFNVKLLAAQALVWGLAMLIGSQFFFIQNPTNRILNGITFVGVIVFGQLLTRSVKREVKQREQLEILTKQLEGANVELSRLDQAKSEFLSIASHQLRTPLTAIKGYTSMLLDGTFGPVAGKLKEGIDKVFASTERMVALVNDLLDTSRLESGRMQFNYTALDLGEVVKSVCDELLPKAQERHVSIACAVPTESFPKLMLDALKIRQVVVNVIDNGIKYSDAETGEVKVTMAIDRAKNEVVVSVQDNGWGMTDEERGFLFKKFSRGRGDTSVIKGTGLGLYVGKQLVEAHGGRIWASSEGKGKGSIFSFALPIGWKPTSTSAAYQPKTE